MQSLIDVHGRYEIPTGWHEVTGRQFCEIDRRKLVTVEQRASYFAGRPIQVNTRVADTLAFLIPTQDDGYRMPTTGGLPYPADLGQETYLQVETIRALLAGKPLHECYTEVYGTFVARTRGFRNREYNPEHVGSLAGQCAELMISETFPAVAHCLAELGRLSTTYAKLAEPDTTEAGARARAAGSDELNMFGHYNVAYAYSLKLGVSLDTVYQMPFENVAIMLLHDRMSAEVQDRMNRNSQPNHE